MRSGELNPLFVKERKLSIRQGGELMPGAVDIGAAMNEPHFTGPASARIAGFGGPVTGWNHSGGTVGSLENTPHGDVHVGVGGIKPLGWMSRFETAGRDPIFWLHHANIDRLWEVWLRQAGGRANPSDAPWLGMRFTIGGGISAVALTVREVLDTTLSPLTYKYSHVPLPEAVPPAVLAARAGMRAEAEEGRMAQDRFPEMVGASENRVALTSQPTEVEVAINRPAGPMLMAEAENVHPRKVYLKIENVKGRELAAPSYRVYVNLPPGADPSRHEDRRAGQVSMFGVVEATEGTGEHGGSGLTFSFDITGVAQRLQDSGDWDPEHLRVTFAPMIDEESQGGNVSAGRVSLFYA
jgi:tyrosinase